jgi:hypothetical protein
MAALIVSFQLLASHKKGKKRKERLDLLQSAKARNE